MHGTRGLPVAIELPDDLSREVAAWAEGEAGWHVVGLDGPPLPAMVLSSIVRSSRPCVVVIDGEPGPEQVRAGLQAGAIDVVGWPAQRERLHEAAFGVIRVKRKGRGPEVFRVGGTAGGAGTSTVALALGGLLAWAGLRTVVVGGDDLVTLCTDGPWSGPGAAELAALHGPDAAAELPGVTRSVAGVPELRVLGGGGLAVGSTAGWPADVVVADVRTATAVGDVDVVLSRPDRSLRTARDPTVPVLVGRGGPLDRAGVRRELGRAPLGWLPESARVARAGLHGRVPSGLPGSWLATLSDTVRAIRRRGGLR